MKVVSDKKPEKEIALSDLTEDFLIVNVFDNKVRILSHYKAAHPDYKQTHALVGLGFKSNDINTASIGWRSVIQRALGVKAEVYAFRNLADFAQAVIDNGWEM